MTSIEFDNIDWYDTDKEHLMKAMLKAEESFQEYFDENDLDGAFFDLKMVGFVLGSDFERLHKIEIENWVGDEDE